MAAFPGNAPTWFRPSKVPSAEGSTARFTFHGRRRGRPLNPSRAQALEKLLPQIGFRLSRLDGRQPAEALFGDDRPIWLEIGFGTGEHLAEMAARHPDIGFIGAEPFINGISALCKTISEQGQENIRIFPDDARPLLETMAPASVDRCFVLFADPWPKSRHADRRFIGPANLRRLARVLKPGADLLTATDDIGLARWMLFHGLADPAFAWLAECAADWREPPEDWVPTRYQGKAEKAGRATTYLHFRRQQENGDG